LTAHQDISDLMPKSESANFYPMTGNPSGFINELPEEEEVEFEEIDLADYQPVSGMTAYQNVGDYYSASNPSGFITGVDLSPYQLTADMTAYQSAGDYLTTADSANFYTTANESGFISEVPAGTMNESAFEYDANDKISGYNGSAFAGGSDVPEGVMVESGLEYNAVNEISGYNGSAIAQYGAEKQWLVHDDTLVHASNSAQYALGVNLSAVAQLLGVDETVLWSGRITATGTTAELSEPLTAFNKLQFILDLDTLGNKIETHSAVGKEYSMSWSYPFSQTFRNEQLEIMFDDDYKTWRPVSGLHQGYNSTGGNYENSINWQWTLYTLKEIRGIGRKEV
jgi:hypothetical protein